MSTTLTELPNKYLEMLPKRWYVEAKHLFGVSVPHVPLVARIALTWLAIFPLVVLTRFLLKPLVGGWPDLFQTALVMALVVPVAVVWAVPLFTHAYLRFRGRTSERGSR